MSLRDRKLGIMRRIGELLAEFEETSSHVRNAGAEKIANVRTAGEHVVDALSERVDDVNESVGAIIEGAEEKVRTWRTGQTSTAEFYGEDKNSDAGSGKSADDAS